MGPVDVHVERLKSRHPDAVLRDMPGVGMLISIPNLPLPQGWTKPSTSVHFLAPQGYPYAKPDCFWTDADLRLVGGGVPQNTGSNAAANLGHLLWFSWHTDHWNAGRDDLLSWLASIKERLSRLC